MDLEPASGGFTVGVPWVSDVWLFYDGFINDEGITENSDRFSTITDFPGFQIQSVRQVADACIPWWGIDPAVFQPIGQWELTDFEQGRGIVIMWRKDRFFTPGNPEDIRRDRLETTQVEWG